MLVLPVLPYPAIDPVLISIGPVAVRWYQLAYSVGIVAAWLYGRAIIKREWLWGGPAPLTIADFDDFVIWIALAVIVGGRAGYVLFYSLPYFAAHPAEILKLWNGGMSFHGAFVCGCMAGSLFGLRRGVPILTLGDLAFAGVPIGIFLGRISNFVNGHLWGRPTDVPWAMIFPDGGPLPRHPSQLYEAALEGIVLFVVLGLLVRAGALKRRGVVCAAFGIFYGVARIFCENFREPDPQLGFLWGGLTMGMLLSIPMVIAGIVVLAVALTRKEIRKSA